MRKFMMTIAALAMSSGVAWGQSASQEIRLSATVGSYCNFNSSSLVLLSADASTIISGNRIPGTTNTPLPIPDGGRTGTVNCSANATISLSSSTGGLRNATAAGLAAEQNTDGAFVNKIHYTATASYGTASLILNSDSITGVGIIPVSMGPTAATTGGAQTGGTLTLGVALKPTTGTKLLVGGYYEDTLTVTLSPAP